MVPAPAGATAMMRAVAREQHQRPSRGRTDRAATGPALSLITGLPDNRREPLEPHHSLYRMASRLRRDQDRLDDRQHRERFIVALDAWPRLRGADSLRETQAQWAGMLLSEGWGPGDVAEVLGVSPDTLRRRKLLRLGETWINEVLGKSPRGDGPAEFRVEGASRLPRVVEGRHNQSVFGLLKTELGDDIPIGDPCVNLPGDFRRPEERGYYGRLLDLRQRPRAA